MKLVIQRVKKAKVTVEGKIVGQIGHGLLVFLGVGEEDKDPTSPFDGVYLEHSREAQGSEGASRVEKMAEKVLKLRIFEKDPSFAHLRPSDSEGFGEAIEGKEKFDKSVLDIKGEILVVPQFTLFADCSKGNRPYFGEAARPEIAKPIFENFLAELKKSGLRVESGVFGAKMEVELVNDGPVTIILDIKY